MVPSAQDFRDFVAHQKWFFGKGPKPQFDRWTYWERFDYFAVFWGVAIIGASGLVMWFPRFFTGFLPGWAINIALILHSDEALLAAGFIFTFHFFNTHFRIEKFPMDTVIFSGRISKTELLHERRRWYDRLTASGPPGGPPRQGRMGGAQGDRQGLRLPLLRHGPRPPRPHHLRDGLAASALAGGAGRGLPRIAPGLGRRHRPAEPTRFRRSP